MVVSRPQEDQARLGVGLFAGEAEARTRGARPPHRAEHVVVCCSGECPTAVRRTPHRTEAIGEQRVGRGARDLFLPFGALTEHALG